ncbi:hypothetical protein [Pseudonocardia hydrocarbonoxydans]|uniref:Uncharacterized protein n=1 Tax=Pseudonocardia hydrocarbonoxydans TaxID=76726 RepID=A0A4Y3WQ77_9PSEU|nr:hypothetical protein [Pseudonocardia hydrocarbonoxydans]GEC20975.1 hypothetical protein PHY01_32580 [Pseudonocardia hydrocarbonoxydans]
MAFTAGAKIRAADLNRLGALVGRNQRTTNSAAITTIARVLSTTAPVVAGRTYRVTCYGELFGNSGAATTQNELRHTTNNTEPTTTSPILGRALVRHDSTIGIPDTCVIVAYFYASATGTLRVAVCTQRVAGTVTVAWTAAPDFPMSLTVEDVGDTIATTGTVY